MDLNIPQLLLMISPVFLIQLGFGIYSLVDLSRRKVVKGKKWIWALLLVFSLFTIPTGIIVSAVYLAWGRNAEVTDDTD
jgi:hypothetical protein